MRSFKEMEHIDVEDMQMLHLLGLPICKYNNHTFSLETVTRPIVEQKFCIVDIETNGSKPSENQIIEIGAVIWQNGQEIGSFSSFVKCDILPESIELLTGITLTDLQDAPVLSNVLEAFRLFIQDAVFVAHNVNFDYYFISYAMEQAGFGPLLNRRLDTIDLAKKCIEAPKYGLSALMEHLGVTFDHHHRALFDAKAAAIVLQKALETLPQDVQNVEALLSFAKPQNQRRPRKEKRSKPSSTVNDTSL